MASTKSWTHIFLTHNFCTILRVHYYHGRNIGPNQVIFPPLLDEAKLNELASFFKMIMMSNVVVAMKPPTSYNPCSKMRALLATNWIISRKLSEWLKFIELSMAMVLGSVKDERWFSIMSFTKSKLRNQLITHLVLIMYMYAQNIYFLKNFSFSIAMKSWTQKKVQRATKQWQHPAKKPCCPIF